MARYRAPNWLDPSGFTATQLSALRICRGTACFAALGVHFETFSPVALERLVDGRMAYLTAGGDRSWSGKYRHWLQGARPSDQTVRQVLSMSGGAVDLGRWRDLDLWHSLTPGPLLRLSAIDTSQYPRPIQEIIGFAVCGPTPAVNITRDQILALRAMKSLDAFRMLVRVARAQELVSLMPDQGLPGVCALDIMPFVLHQNPQLRFRWWGLFECVARILGRSVPGSDGVIEVSRDRIVNGLAELDADPNATLGFLR